MDASVTASGLTRLPSMNGSIRLAMPPSRPYVVRTRITGIFPPVFGR